MDYKKIAQELIRLVGGKANISSVTHCFTRLRFVLKDESKANKKAVEAVEGVISVVISGGQFQVVCGAKVEHIYEAVISELGADYDGGLVNAGDGGGQGLGNRILQTITQIFTPLVPAIAAAGLIKGLLTAARLLMNNYGIDLAANDTYTILMAASQVIFYFMPIFLAMTAAKAMKVNQVIAMVIGGLLCYPGFDKIIQDVATSTTIFGLPVIKGVWEVGEAARTFSYTESVIPILLVVLVMVPLERALKRWIPSILQIILVPGLTMIIMIPAVLVVLGPIGIYVGNVIQWVYESIMAFSTILGGALLGGLWGVLVIFGAHRAVLPIGLNDVAMNGKQNLLAFAGAANFAQGGAALGVALKTKNIELKQVAASGSLSAFLVGITEPAIYGVNLRLKRPMVYAIIAGAIGGAIMGYGDVYGDAFANNGILTIFTYAAFGMRQFVFYLVGISVAFFGAAALSYFLGFTDVDVPSTPLETKEETDDRERSEEEQVLYAPLEGKTIALEDVEDQVFSTKAMGEGIAIDPSGNIVTAPNDGEVTVVYPSLHALGLKLDNGVECIIHIGMDTVELKGEGFTAHVEVGQHVQKGQTLVSFDRDLITGKGYSLVTPLVIVNSKQFKYIIPDINKQVDSDTVIIRAGN